MTNGTANVDTLRPRPMNMQSLPQYRGLADAPKLWRERDGHGKSPFFRIRDYVILALMFMLLFPTTPYSLKRFWELCQRNRRLDVQRDEAVSGGPKPGEIDGTTR